MGLFVGGFGDKLGGFGAVCHNALTLDIPEFKRDFNDKVFYDKPDL